MMDRLLVGWVAIAAVSVLGCRPDPGSTEPFPGYAHVLAGRDCPPAGGGAVSLVFRPAPDSFDATGPQLRVAVWRDIGSLLGRTFVSADRPSTGGGYECGDSTTCAPLRSWRVRFERLGPDSSLGGDLEVRGERGPVRRGHFRALWHSRVVYCI